MFDSLPPEVLSVVREFRTCEFTSLTKRGRPVTWPVTVRYLPDQVRFLLTTSIGFPQKIFHIRRNPHVSLLFSDPTGSGLEYPPAVLIQGNAEAGDKIVTAMDAVEGLRDYWRDTIFGRQSASAIISAYPLIRKMMDWYYMRVVIHVTPCIVTWWPEGDFNRPAHRMETTHVG